MNNGIKHICLVPTGNKQWSNYLKKIKEGDIETQPCKIALQYCTIAHSIEGLLHAERLLKGNYETKFIQTFNSIKQQVVEKERYNQRAKQREFLEGDLTFFCREIFTQLRLSIFLVTNFIQKNF